MLTIQNYHSFVGHSGRISDGKMVVVNQVYENGDDYCIEVVFSDIGSGRFCGLERFYLRRVQMNGCYHVNGGQFSGKVARAKLLDMEDLMHWILGYIIHFNLC